jgi:hypothetical protein
MKLYGANISKEFEEKLPELIKKYGKPCGRYQGYFIFEKAIVKQSLQIIERDKKSD